MLFSLRLVRHFYFKGNYSFTCRACTFILQNTENNFYFIYSRFFTIIKCILFNLEIPILYIRAFEQGYGPIVFKITG